jgi:hypothetical protein
LGSAAQQLRPSLAAKLESVMFRRLCSSILILLALMGCTAPPVRSPAGTSTAPSFRPVETQPAQTDKVSQPGSSAVTQHPASTPTQASPDLTPPDLEPSATPAAAALTQPPTLRPLTGGGCCSNPFWSPDSRRVLYIDHPYPAAQSGLWSVDLNGGAPAFVTDHLGIFSSDLSLRAYPDKGRTVVERLSDGQRWIIPDGGRAVSFSPDGSLLAWTAGQSGPPFDSIQRQVWVSRVDGSQARQVATLTGGGFSDWFTDNRLLLNGRLPLPDNLQVVWMLNLPAPGESAAPLQELARGERLRSTMISPSGRWLAYGVTFSADPAQDGLWLVNVSDGRRYRLDMFGAYHWRDGDHLLVIPLDLSGSGQSLWQVDAETGVVVPLTDPAVTSFKVANNDWSVSPDGHSIVFVSAEDNNLWLLSLP